MGPDTASLSHTHPLTWEETRTLHRPHLSAPLSPVLLLSTTQTMSKRRTPPSFHLSTQQASTVDLERNIKPPLPEANPLGKQLLQKDAQFCARLSGLPTHWTSEDRRVRLPLEAQLAAAPAHCVLKT